MKKRYKVIIGLLCFIIILMIIGAFFQDSDQIGRFRTAEGERSYKEAYENAMKNLPYPDKAWDLETDFGSVRVYQFINEENSSDIPIVLLPGRTSGTPMWEENLEGLMSERTIYTIDILGDAGMSVQTKPIKDSYDQALWLEQVFDEIGLSEVHLLGHSFGGWNAANYAVHYPERVSTLSLLEPVLVFTGLRWDFYIKSIFITLPFIPDKIKENILADIGGTSEIDMDDSLARMIGQATEHYSVALPLPKVLKYEELSQLDMPVYVALGEKSVLHETQRAYDKAVQNIDHLTIKIWEDGSHSLPMEYTQELNLELLEFMRKTDYY